MNPLKEKEWHQMKGKIQLFKNDRLIREYGFQHIYGRRRILRIWISEIKPNGEDEYYLIIKPNLE
jgi:hypothetical protein